MIQYPVRTWTVREAKIDPRQVHPRQIPALRVELYTGGIGECWLKSVTASLWCDRFMMLMSLMLTWRQEQNVGDLMAIGAIEHLI